jgi:antitoxin Phd
MRRWQLQEAKAKLSELVKEARQRGPQEISVRGQPVAVVMSCPDYERLARRKPSFVDFIRRSPLAGVELPIERDRSSVRTVEL